MTDKTTRIGLVASIGIAGVIVGFHPLFALPAAAGAWFPDLDVGSEVYHRSWGVHTFLPPTLLYGLVHVLGLPNIYPFLLDAVHFFTLGMCAHFLLDYVYPRRMTHNGSAWPIKPTIWSMPWGFFWLAIAWGYQWFFYLSRHFLPWLFGFGA